MTHRPILPRRRGSVAPGPSFKAAPDFPGDFELVWHRQPWCHHCRHKIRPGDPVAWLRSGDPASLHHQRCLAKADAKPLPATGTMANVD